VLHQQLTDLQQQCLLAAHKHQATMLAAAAAASSSSSDEASSSAASTSSAASASSSSSSASRARQLREAAEAALATYSRVVSKVEAYQRSEPQTEKRLKAQGVPWSGRELVAGIKEACVALGAAYTHAVLGQLREAEAQLAAAQQELAGGDGSADGTSSSGGGGTASRMTASAAGAGSTLWGCRVHDPKQQARLARAYEQQARQAARKRWQLLDQAVTLLFKLHQFAGGFDGPTTQAFLQLQAQVDAQALVVLDSASPGV
jgi:hypothetical protein